MLTGIDVDLIYIMKKKTSKMRGTKNREILCFCLIIGKIGEDACASTVLRYSI